MGRLRHSNVGQSNMTCMSKEDRFYLFSQLNMLDEMMLK